MFFTESKTGTKQNEHFMWYTIFSIFKTMKKKRKKSILKFRGVQVA